MLRPLTETDAAWLTLFLTNNEWPFHAGELDDGKTVAQRLESGYFHGSGVETLVVECNSVPVGIVRIFDLDDDTPLFDLRISEEHRGRGLGGAALRALVDRVFTEHRVNRLEGTTRQDNVAMRRAFVSAGFVKEAHYRRAWRDRDDTMHDSVGYAILRVDWESGSQTPVDWNDEPA